MEAVTQSDIVGLTLIARGKVRDIYRVDDKRLAIVATDRLSAYDVVLPDALPGKGVLLTELSRFWFEWIDDRCRHHLTPLSLTDVAGDTPANRALDPRTMIVEKLTPLPIEAVVRGYLIGSGWRDYLDTGAVCGITLPTGFAQAAQLDTPLFTPATKAAVGDHDENIDFARCVELVGQRIAEQVRDLSLSIYQAGAAYARARGIIIADTKFEFGLDDAGELVLIDEVLTPDSSRFWPADQYAPGQSPPSYDKQFVRDYLETLDWDKQPPGPTLPKSVIDGTLSRYREAITRLTAETASPQ